MSAVFAASTLWRRGSVSITEDDMQTITAKIEAITAEEFRKSETMIWEEAEDTVVERLDDNDQDEPPDLTPLVLDEARKVLLAAVIRIQKFIDEDGGNFDPIGGVIHIGPYEVLIFAEASYGDVSEEAARIDTLSEFRVFEAAGFYDETQPPDRMERFLEAVGTDFEAEIIEPIRERAGLIWTCRNDHLPWTNSEGDTCEECGLTQEESERASRS